MFSWQSMNRVFTDDKFNQFTPCSTGPVLCCRTYPDSKFYGANMGPTWLLSAPDGPHVGPMNLAIREDTHRGFETSWDFERKPLIRNRPIPLIPQFIRQTFHNAPFEIEHCGIWDCCIVGSVQQVCWKRHQVIKRNIAFLKRSLPVLIAYILCKCGYYKSKDCFIFYRTSIHCSVEKYIASCYNGALVYQWCRNKSIELRSI